MDENITDVALSELAKSALEVPPSVPIIAMYALMAAVGVVSAYVYGNQAFSVFQAFRTK